jgi:hypothetical protein
MNISLSWKTPSVEGEHFFGNFRAALQRIRSALSNQMRRELKFTPQQWGEDRFKHKL